MTPQPVPPAAAVADALVRMGRVPRRAARSTARLRHPDRRARPLRHSGSVDVFLEAIGRARRGILVIDNASRLDGHQ
jgi:hypothetical protein